MHWHQGFPSGVPRNTRAFEVPSTLRSIDFPSFYAIDRYRKKGFEISNLLANEAKSSSDKVRQLKRVPQT